MSEKVSPNNIPNETPVSNRDVFPSDEFLVLYPEFKSLLQMKMIGDFFRDTDGKAVVRKKIFVKLGTLSLISVTSVLVLLSWRLSLSLLSIGFPFWLEFASAVLGAIAIFIQLYLFFSNMHQNWLFSRYMAEKSRLWKFQLLLDGEFVSNYVQSSNAFQHELDKRWLVFKEEFKHGFGGMNEYIESQPLELMTKPTPYTDQNLLLKLKEIYLMLRINVQSTHFGDQYSRLAFIDTFTDSWAKVLLSVSGVLAIVEACLLGLQASDVINFQSESFKILIAILAGASLTFAIASAAIRVYRSASAVSENRERYRSKQHHLKRIRELFKEETNSAKIHSLMIETENVCNEELQEFLISLRRADYFF